MICRTLPLFVLLLVAPVALAQPAGYGATDFPNSGAAEAQEPFLRGLLMLHSFEYDDAREAFQEAQRIDPDFAMAYWGEALTHNHPVWMDQDREAARAALDKLAPTAEGRLARAPTEREKDYLRALDVLFGDGDKETRDFAYADAMDALSRAYPDDLDAAAFYALSILGTAHRGRDFATYMEAAAVAEEVFAANPDHPGAAHYLIHAYDDPIHAPLGLRPARVYAGLAPAASHALHMPSHIYFALGMWDEGAEMNERSYEAAAARAERRAEPLNGHGRHALYWLHYAYLQQGRFAAADSLVERVAAMAAADTGNRFHHLLSSLRAHHVVETDGLDAAGGSGMHGATPSVTVLEGFARGLSALRSGDVADAERALAAMQDALAEERTEDERNAPLRILALQLEALLKHGAGQSDEALALLDEAAALEDAMPIDFGPPSPVRPAHELLGDVLLDLGEPAEARLHFEETLARYPRRSRAMLGLARAAMQEGDTATAYAAYANLADSWHGADPNLPALAEVQERAAMYDR